MDVGGFCYVLCFASRVAFFSLCGSERRGGKGREWKRNDEMEESKRFRVSFRCEMVDQDGSVT